MSHDDAPYSPEALKVLEGLKPNRKRPQGFIAGDPAPVPADRDIVEVIGDIHGEADLLEALLNDIEARHGKPDGVRIVFLGDIVDRGPESAACTTRVAEALEEFPGSVLLCGNHDQMFRDFLNRGVADDAWLKQGGFETLTSYEIPDVELTPATRINGEIGTKLRGGIMFYHPSHYDLLAHKAAYSAVVGPFLFAHAGVHPNKMLGNQHPDDLMWIRKEFLDVENETLATPGIVVHGHTTVVDVPEIRSYRINLDTGCGKSKSAPLSMMTIDLKARKLSVRQALRMSDDVVVYPVDIDRMTVGEVPWLSETAITAARQYNRVLVHCVMGQARSAAIGLAIIADRLGSGHEAEACELLERMRPIANDDRHVFVPNLHVLRLTDEALSAGGRLQAAWLAFEEQLAAKGSNVGVYRQWRSSPLAALAQEESEEENGMKP